MPIVFGIDGTGPGEGDYQGGSNTSYQEAFVKSFVSRICKKPSRDALYLRGPINYGAGLVPAINQGYQFILDRYKAPDGGSKPYFPPRQFGHPVSGKSILLTGYSRGGAGVVEVARKLSLQKIPVAAMLLFDAVDRHAFIDSTRIPDNVTQVMHVKRNPASGSRWSFGNCASSWNETTTFVFEQYFMCTHGGMGGTPWPCPKGGNPKALIKESPPDGLKGPTTISYEEDAKVSVRVWKAVLPFITNFGFMM